MPARQFVYGVTMIGYAPSFLEEFFHELYTTRLEPVRRSPECLPGEMHPLVISVVQNEIDNVSNFIEYYRSHGIRRFIIIDNNSSDGTREFLEREDDVDLYFTPTEFNSVRKQGWIARIVMLYGYARWYLIVDADEHVVFDGIEGRTFHDLTSIMTRRGIYRVRGFLLDMYNGLPLISAFRQAASKLRDDYPLFDKGPYRQEAKAELFSVKGGVRSRVFGGIDARFDPELTKYPLLRLFPGEFPVHPHYAWPYEQQTNNNHYISILHYKFGNSFRKKVEDAVRRSQYWNGSLEYKIYKKIIDANPKIILTGENSAKYTNSSQLVDFNLLLSIDWGS